MYGVCIKTPDWIQAVERLDNTKFQHIELNITDVSPTSIIFDKNYLTKLKSVCVKKNISISLHCLRGINLGEKIDRIREASLDIVRDCLVASNFLSARWLTIHLGTARIANNDIRKYDRLDFVVDALKRLLENGSETFIGIENERYTKDYDKPTRLGDSPEEIEYILKEVNDSRIKFIYDMGHSLLYQDRAEQYIQLLFDKIIALHLHTNDGINDLHLPITPGDLVLTQKHISYIEKLKLSGCPILFECKTMDSNLISYNNYMKILGGMQ